jgi:hypothetical protein
LADSGREAVAPPCFHGFWPEQRPKFIVLPHGDGNWAGNGNDLICGVVARNFAAIWQHLPCGASEIFLA